MITGIILASGFSKRMGEDKLLLKINDETIIEKVIKAAYKSKLDRIILVYRKKEIEEIGKRYGIETIYNENPEIGQSQSMKLGIKKAGKTKAYMFIVGDQPFLKENLINKLLEEYEREKLPIVIPYFNGKRSMPIIMSSIYKEELLNVEGDKGGRDIVGRNHNMINKVDLEEEKILIDVDTPGDFERILNKNLRR